MSCVNVSLEVWNVNVFKVQQLLELEQSKELGSQIDKKNSRFSPKDYETFYP